MLWLNGLADSNFPHLQTITCENLAASISQILNGAENPYSISLSELRQKIGRLRVNDETRLRMENEIEDSEFRLKRGFDSGRFNQFWDNRSLLECKYSRSKWLYLDQESSVPLDVYAHALKGNRNAMHITFGSIDDGWTRKHSGDKVNLLRLPQELARATIWKLPLVQ